jgi:hypothetical protein
MRTAAKHLRVERKRFWRLNVKPDNHSARRLYESMGLTVAYQAVSLRFPWASLGRIPAGKASIGDVRPERDREIESAFGLPAGQLASARDLNRIMLDASVVGHDDVAGLAVFDPNFPGAFPFRVRDLGALEPLMTAIQVRARPDDVFLGIVVEDDARLADLARLFCDRRGSCLADNTFTWMRFRCTSYNVAITANRVSLAMRTVLRICNICIGSERR